VASSFHETTLQPSPNITIPINTIMSHMLATPDEPFYILKEHVASEAVNIRAKVNGKGEFTFSRSSAGAPGEVLFTVDSRSGLCAPRRLIKDATGTGVLELRRNSTRDESYIAHPNNGNSRPLAVVVPRKTVSKDKVDVYAKNAAREDQETKLEVRGQDIWKRNTLVYWRDDLVMQLRFVSYVTSYVPFASNQWNVTVAQGFDLSLVSSVFTKATSPLSTYLTL
jgi:hypothetical protein